MKARTILREISLISVILVSLSLATTAFETSAVSNPIAAFTYESCVLCLVPGDAVSFNATWSTSTANIVSYTWDFGDGSPLVKTTSAITGHFYGGNPAKWLVTLTVQDSSGLTDTVAQQVLFQTIPRFTIQPSPSAGPQPSFLFNATNSISYNATSPIKEYDWDFGDGTTGTGAVIIHAYTTPTTYRIQLTLLTSYGNPSVSETLSIGQGPVVTYTVITDKDTYIPGEVVHAKLNATNQGTQPATFTFNDACGGFRFVITDPVGSLVYTNVPPPLAPCALVITTVTIQPGQTLTVATLDWPQTNTQGQEVPAGTYIVTGVLHYQSPYQTTPLASKTITIQAPDYSLSISPTGLTVAKGSSGTLTITATALNGFIGTITFTTTISPSSRHTPALSAIGPVKLTTTNTSGTTTLTVFTNRSTSNGTYAITVTGTSGTTSHAVSATLTVTTK